MVSRVGYWWDGEPSAVTIMMIIGGNDGIFFMGRYDSMVMQSSFHLSIGC